MANILNNPLNNPIFGGQAPASFGNQPNVINASDNAVGRALNSLAMSLPAGRKMAFEQQQMQALQQQQELDNTGRLAAAQALVELGNAKTPQEASMIIGSAVANGADPSFFADYTKSTLSPQEIMGEGGPKITSKFNAIRSNAGAVERKPQTVVNVGEGKRETEFQKKRGEGDAVRINKIIEDSDNAVTVSLRNNRSLERIKQAMKAGTGTTGPFDAARMFLGQLSAQAGIADDFNISETTNLTALQAASTELVIDSAKKLGVNPTDNDVDMITGSLPKLGNDVVANRLLVNIGQRINEAVIERHQFIQEALDRGLDRELPSIMAKYDDETKLDLPPLPKEVPLINGAPDVSKLEQGKEYVIGQQIFVYDGEKFIKSDF